jgi:hypothetical protein
MITITKRGPVYLNSKDGKSCICNRPGIVVESVKDDETTICVNTTIQNPYTISYASEGTPFSFFSVSRKKLRVEYIEKAWFIDFERAYFLCALNQLDGFLNIRNETPIGDIILKNLNESDFQELDRDYAYTFLLDGKNNLKLIYIWDIECQQFISPMSQLWKVPYFSPTNFIVKKDGNTFPLTETQMKNPLVECNCGITLKNSKPLLVTIYCKGTIYTIRVMTKTDFKINKIRNSAPGKYEALLLAKLKGDDTADYETRYFTKRELDEFHNQVKLGFRKFREEIYQKSVLRNWVCFPDKIYNTIRLGDIIDSNLSCEGKQESACKAIKNCVKGWRKKALFDFYKSYVE